jgi:putative ABC transport system permease protein
MQTRSSNRTRSGPAIWFRLRADLRGRRWQAGSVLLVVALATWLIGMGLVIFGSVSAPFDRLFTQLNGAHLWVYTSLPLSPGQFDAIIHAPGVVASTQLEEGAENGNVLVGQETLGANIQSFPADQPAIGKLLITRGQGLALDDPNGVIIDQAFAQAQHLHPGATLHVVTEQGLVPVHVRGVAIDVNHDSAQDGTTCRIHLLRATLEQLFPALRRYGVIGLQLADPTAIGAATADIFQRLQAQGFPAAKGNPGLDNWMTFRADFGTGTRLTAIVLLAFGIVSLVAAGFIVANLVIGQVLAQQRDLGILKAVGFTPSQLVRALVLEYALLGAAGGVVGLVLAALAAPWLLGQLTATLGVPVPPLFSPLVIAGVLAALLVTMALCAGVPALRAGRTRVVDVIRPGGVSADGRRSRLGSFFLRAGVPVVVALGIRGMTARPVRTVLVALTLLLGVMTAIFALEANATLQQYSTDPTLTGVFADAFMSPGVYDPLATQRLIASQSDIAYYYATFQQEAFWADGRGTLGMLFTSGDPRRVEATITSGRWFHDGADEMVVSAATLQDLRARVGDRIPLRFTLESGQQVIIPYTIVGTIFITQRLDQAYAPLSSFVMHTGDTAATVAASTGYEITLRSGIAPATFIQSLEAQTDERIGARVYTLNVPPGVAQGVSLMGYVGVALLLIAGVGMLNAMLLATRERYRELATLKAIGLTPGQMLRSVTDGALALGVLTLMIGIPLGLLLSTVGLSELIQQLSKGTLPTIQIGVNWLGIGLLIPATLAIAALGAYLPARWAARVSVGEVLRYE